MIQLDNVRALSVEEFDRRLENVEAHQYVIELSTAGCVGEPDLFERVRALNIPMDPELGHESWDAMVSSMTNGLSDLRESEVFLFWKDFYEPSSLPQAIKYQALLVFVSVADRLGLGLPDEAKDLWILLRREPGKGSAIAERVSIPGPPYR